MEGEASEHRESNLLDLGKKSSNRASFETTVLSPQRRRLSEVFDGLLIGTKGRIGDHKVIDDGE